LFVQSIQTSVALVIFEEYAQRCIPSACAGRLELEATIPAENVQDAGHVCPIERKSHAEI
jgi:hypothetical protein